GRADSRDRVRRRGHPATLRRCAPRRRARRPGGLALPLSRHHTSRSARLPRSPRIPGPAVNLFYHRIYRVVKHIPKGRVATYGVVARLAGRPGAARTVGWALSALPHDTDKPWWRVINSAGRISLATHDHGSVLQRALLLREGVRFSPGGAVN